ncbi:MAG: hypothetical protein WC581_08605 [Thermodesulfovibrionales bacterium]
MQDDNILKLKFIQKSLFENNLRNHFADVDLLWAYCYSCDLLPGEETYQQLKVIQKALYELCIKNGFKDGGLVDALTYCSYNIGDEDSCHILLRASDFFLKNGGLDTYLRLLGFILNLQYRSHLSNLILTLPDFHKKMLFVSELLNLPTINISTCKYKKDNINLAYIIDVIAEGHGPTKAIMSMLKYHDRSIFNLFVFVTDYLNDSKQLGMTIIKRLMDDNIRVIFLEPPGSCEPEKIKKLAEQLIVSSLFCKFSSGLYSQGFSLVRLCRNPLHP